MIPFRAVIPQQGFSGVGDVTAGSLDWLKENQIVVGIILGAAVWVLASKTGRAVGGAVKDARRKRIQTRIAGLQEQIDDLRKQL